MQRYRLVFGKLAIKNIQNHTLICLSYGRYSNKCTVLLPRSQGTKIGCFCCSATKPQRFCVVLNCTFDFDVFTTYLNTVTVPLDFFPQICGCIPRKRHFTVIVLFLLRCYTLYYHIRYYIVYYK